MSRINVMNFKLFDPIHSSVSFVLLGERQEQIYPGSGRASVEA